SMARHAGAAENDRVGAVLVLEFASDLDEPPERAAVRALCDRHLERALAGEALGKPHLPQIAQVPADRALADGDDPEPLGARERGEDAAFGDAEYRARRALAAQMQARIAVAGDDERVGSVVGFDEATQRQGHAFDIGLTLDPERTLLERRADDLRAAGEAHARRAPAR